MGARPLIGRFSTSRMVIAWPADADTVCRGGASEETVTLSVAAPNVSCMSTPTREVLASSIPDCTYFLKPATSAEIS